ncbi:hypothetical protein CBM2629_U30022 [Cupriavidus taiwanensis]|nr:hypothetical protein CBM2629_U30022 [Cupriavidus taiwanensis]
MGRLAWSPCSRDEALFATAESLIRLGLLGQSTEITRAIYSASDSF